MCNFYTNIKNKHCSSLKFPSRVKRFFPSSEHFKTLKALEADDSLYLSDKFLSHEYSYVIDYFVNIVVRGNPHKI